MQDLPNLDFLRACAAISVVVEHVLLAYNIRWLGRMSVEWIGVAGVFFFFVHTSLVLMWSLERRPHTLDFYIRRIFRIYPLAIVAIVLALSFHAPVSSTPDRFFHFERPSGALNLFSALTLTGNLFFGYLPVGVLWTLYYEVQMYLLLPVIFFFVSRNFSRWPLLLLWLFSVAACRHLFWGVPHNFFLCIPWFLPGIIAYVGFGRSRAFLPWWLFPIALAILWTLFLCDPSWRHGDLLCLAAGLALPAFRQMSLAWFREVSHQLAKYSYGIYLMHPFAIAIGIYLLPHRAVALQLSALLLSLIALAALAYHLIERPMIRIGSRLASRASQRYEQHELQRYRIPEAEIR